MNGIIFNLQRFCIHDGPGIRTTVFLKGCPLECPWCHNPEGRLADVPEDREIDVDDLLQEVERDRPFYEETGGGVTFSGGEPLVQGDFLLECLDACRERGLRTAVDTCGFAPRELMQQVAARTDLVLFDLKLTDEARHRELTGAPLAPILANLRELDARGRRIWIRLPMVPGINDRPEDLEAVGILVASLESPRQIHLLPFHKLAAAKYHRLGRDWPPADLDKRVPADLQEAAARLRRHGLKVVIGG